MYSSRITYGTYKELVNIIDNSFGILYTFIICGAWRVILGKLMGHVVLGRKCSIC